MANGVHWGLNPEVVLVEGSPDLDNGIERLPFPMRLMRMTVHADSGP